MYSGEYNCPMVVEIENFLKSKMWFLYAPKSSILYCVNEIQPQLIQGWEIIKAVNSIHWCSPNH
jgi:hypothetical protein